MRDGGGSIILAEHGTRVVGVAVDEVMDVQAIAEEPVEGLGVEERGLEGVARQGADLILGQAQLGERVIDVLFRGKTTE